MLNNRLNIKQIFNATSLKLGLKLNQHCLLCADFNGGEIGLCTGCLNDLPWYLAPHCPQCALPSNGLICGSCLNSPPNFDATQALFSYDFPVDALLQHFKYHHLLHLAKTFADLLLQQKLQESTKNSAIHLIIPMPMHPQRLKERGFNQALEIARILADHLNIPLDYESCTRVKLAPPQASLPLKERIKNMHGVLDCKKNMHDLNIAIMDDVMTSGASLNALAKLLKKMGAAHVECWVIARTLPK